MLVTKAIPRSVVFGTAVFAIVYFTLDLNRYFVYDTSLDFFIFAQGVADRSGLLRTGFAGSHFGDHFSPIYDLVVPLGALVGSPIALIAFQTVAAALTAPGLFRIARRFVSQALAVRIAMLALVYPPFAGIVFGDPSEACFAPAATVWLFAFVLERRWVAAAVVAALALAIKEDQAIFLMFDGIVAIALAVRTGDVALRRFAVAIVATAAIVLASFLFVIQPAIIGRSVWGALSVVSQAAPSDPSGGRSIWGRVGYLAEMLVPLAFLPIVGWRVLVFAIPSLAEVLLARNSAVWSMGEHYAGVWIGYVLIAGTYGAYVLARRSPNLARRFVDAALVICVANLIFASPTHWRRHLRLPSDHDRALDATIASVMAKPATIGTQDELLSHLWSDPGARYGLRSSPHYALIDTSIRDSFMGRKMSEDIAIHRYGRYRRLSVVNGIALYERSGP